MALTEVATTTLNPYGCFVRGKPQKVDGDDVHTIGFKDGLAVVQVMPSDMKKATDNGIDNKTIDLTKLQKVSVKVDPVTRKKYIIKDGRKIEFVSKPSNLVTVKAGENQLRLRMAKPDEGAARQALVVKSPQSLGLSPKLTPVVGQTIKMLDSVKYHVLSVNVRKPGGARANSVSTMTEAELEEHSQRSDKTAQTECEATNDASTQTDHNYHMDGFIKFILGEEDVTYKKIIDPDSLKTKEEMEKFSFFTDMRTALNFDGSGNLPIHNSVVHNKTKALAKNCVVLKAIKESVDVTNQQGSAPLHLAIIHNVDMEIVRLLLSHGANVGVPDGDGNTALHLAIEHRRPEMLRLIIDGAMEARFNLNVFNYEGFTPLILACLNGSIEDAKLLLSHGADPNVKDMKSGRTALFHAAEAHDVDLVELLMQHKADTKIRNFFGTSPHDAMFELDEIPLKIKFCILGRDHQRFQTKKKCDGRPPTTGLKKAKLETTPVLRKVSSSDMIGKSNKRK